MLGFKQSMIKDIQKESVNIADLIVEKNYSINLRWLLAGNGLYLLI